VTAPHNTMTRLFTRKIENFICAHCNARVCGNGYTNHCPECLYSKDVDVNPGDRAAVCHGLMRPISVTSKKDGYVILHKCEKCGKERNNKSADNDNFDAILKATRHNFT